jgi:serine/threonine protein kinase
MADGKRTAAGLIGVVLNESYRIDKLLGAGGMGAVYQATHLRLEEPVAIKVMASDLVAKSGALERFHREARVTSGLRHPHIVQVSDFGTTPTAEPYLVMEFLEGEDLDQRLRREKQLPLTTTVHIINQIASALTATHAKGIVHRDLKPANIFILTAAGERDFVKVLDFGISKVRSASTKLTGDFGFLGTPNYMAPEQAQGKIDEIDDRTDQWAMACIAWECLAGESAFPGDTFQAVYSRIVEQQPVSILSKVPNLAPKVEDALLRALTKKKDGRFPSVAEFAAALDSAASGASAVSVPGVAPTAQLTPTVADLAAEAGLSHRPLPGTTFTQTAGEVAPSPRRGPPRRWRWIVGACAGVGILVLIVLLRPGHRHDFLRGQESIPASAPLPTLSPPPAARSEQNREAVPVPSPQAPLEDAPQPATEPEPPPTPMKETTAKTRPRRSSTPGGGAAPVTRPPPTVAQPVPPSAPPPTPTPQPAPETIVRPPTGSKGGAKW